MNNNLSQENFYTKKSTLTGTAILLLMIVCAAYSNHFTNGFQYDDFPSIVDNVYIRDIKNIPLFFTDVKYFGTNFGNQGYRPVLVTLNAIDYWLAGGLKPVFFHADIFLSYIVLLVLLYLLFKNIFNKSQNSRDAMHGASTANKWIALLAVGFYGLHAANAETINYIVQRADSFSTLLIVASLLLYIHPKARKYYLYLFTIALAIGTKEVGVVASVLIFFYILFFEENVSLMEFISFKKTKTIFHALKKSLPALIVSFLVFKFGRSEWIRSLGLDYDIGGAQPPALNYNATELVVFVHYLGNFFLPLNLSMSKDFIIYSSIIEPKIIISFLIIVALFVVAFITSRKKEQRPIAFGIVWFFVGLVPASIVATYSELANDHRTFLPYIGLVLSVACYIRLLCIRYPVLSTKYFLALYFIIISLHAYGTYQRNKVWSSSENLWHDAVVKSPGSAIANMSYGLVLMEKGKYDETLPYFEQAVALRPEWAYSLVNMALLKDYMGLPQEADSYFKQAIGFQPYYPVGYYQYARFLIRYGKKEEAIAQLETGLKISPGDARLIELLNLTKPESAEDVILTIKAMAANAEQNPSVANYLNLSVVYYQQGMYEECIAACEKALKLDPQNAMAYNNICGSYNAIGQWAKAAEACKKSLERDPNLELAKMNLDLATKNLK